MRQRGLGGLLSLLLCALVGFVAFLYLSEDRMDRGEVEGRLAAAVTRKLSTDAEVRVSLAAVTDFNWERVCVFGPYTSAAQIDAALGFPWPEALNTGIDMFDSFNLVAFVANGEVVRYMKYPYGSGRFEGISVASRCFAPERAVFRVENQGANGLVLYPERP